MEEWVSMWDEYARNPSAALKWQQQYCHFMFQLEDASADGSIDCDEFTTVCSSYGIDQNECKVAFQKMAKVRFINTEKPQRFIFQCPTVINIPKQYVLTDHYL